MIQHTVGRHTIHQGDCLTVMEEMDPGSVDVICTSPPYNLGKGYSDYNDDISWDSYYNSLCHRVEAMHRVLANDGSFFLNYGYAPREPWKLLSVLDLVRDSEFEIQNMIVWVKSIAMGDETKGHYQPINSARFLNHNWEFVIHCTRHGETPIDRLALGVPYMDKSNLDRWDTLDDVHCAGDIWFIPYTTIQSTADDRKSHPATFPLELPTRCIKLHGITTDLTVFDPYMGIGTTLAACEQLGVRGIGAEYDGAYVASAIDIIQGVE